MTVESVCCSYSVGNFCLRSDEASGDEFGAAVCVIGNDADVADATEPSEGKF